ncbi:hypothetical protein FACS1894182_11190 [Bacteroidia bacterium]|nr:hypothetical protein FACS1894182_11190 [Bacteroidia bacterium]
MQAQTVTPGGVNSSELTYLLWLTPESYNNGTWTNLITTTGTVGDFTQPSNWGYRTPPVKAVGNNFHYAAQFRPPGQEDALNRLQSDNGIGITVNDAVTIIVVYKATNTGWDRQHILNFGGNSTYEGEYSLLYRTNNNNTLSLGWPTTNYRNLGAVPFGTPQLVTVDVNNSNSGTSSEKIRAYLNGAVNSSLSLGNINGSVDYKIVLGGAYWDLPVNSARGFNGDVQEVIILKRARTSFPFLADVNSGTDLRKLHSYLAIKYGISLSTDYYASDGTTKVWDITADPTYNNHIFGIGRDDDYGLYQKQSQSASNAAFTVFVGNSLAVLNSQNTSGTLNNKQYAMFGSNGGDINDVTLLPSGSEIPVPGSSSEINYRSSLIYKVQLKQGTGSLPSMKVKFSIAQGAPVPQNMLISMLPTFDAGSTQVIPMQGKNIIEVDVSDGCYITFGGYVEGANKMPGNVPLINLNNLKLWLRADNTVSITSYNETNNEDKLTGYPGSYPAGAYMQPDTYGKLNTVRAWKDIPRNVTYSVRTGTTNDAGNQRAPIYCPNPMEMNYHPSVQFWGTTSAGAYLSNTAGMFGTKAAPENNEHTAIYVVNNYPALSGSRTYYMTFGSSYPAGSTPSHSATYGIQTVGSNVYPVFNTTSDQQTDASKQNQNLPYKQGSTTIMAYRTNGASGGGTGQGQGNGRITFGVDGRTTSEMLINFGTFAYNSGSTMGIGYNHDRQLNGLISEVIIFEEKLSDVNLELVEAYLGAKYGITLHGKTAGSNFDYKMSDLPGTPQGSPYTYWAGESNAVYRPFHNNVAAIIRDDVSSLRNRQSHSTESGSMLHIGVGGVPGAQLDINGASTLGEFENDNEVVAWGHNLNAGSTTSDYFHTIPLVGCNKFNKLFKRRWLVHKKTAGDQPIKLLVGLQNNSANNLGTSADAETQALYATLVPGNEVFMIVAETEADLNNLVNNNDVSFAKAVIPMTYLNGEFQCGYTFTDETYYITFAYLDAGAKCMAQNGFEGKKTFTWDQWTTHINHQLGDNTQGTRNVAKTVPATPFEKSMGDNITVKTSVTYDQGVYTYAYYPRVSTATRPTQGFEINRMGSNQNGKKVMVRIEFNDAVIPDFALSGIDSRGSNGSLTYDKVEVYGLCDAASSNKIFPVLSKASSSPDAYINISGNTATATARVSGSNSYSNSRNASSDLGTVNVAFQSAVKYLYVVYTITGRENASSGNNNNTIWISPISFKSGPPLPPLVNEDGLAFTKEVVKSNIDACHDIYYVFEIRNVNTHEKYVKFTDVLTESYLTWKENSLGLDEFNNDNNPDIKINNYGGSQTLEIDSLLIPCGSTIRFTATAQIDDRLHWNAALGAKTTYANRASITYEHIVDKYVNPTAKDTTAYSVDLYTHNDYSLVTIQPSQRYQPVSIVTVVNPKEYVADSETEVEIRLNNPNSETLQNLYANFSWNEGFTLVPNSLTFSIGAKGTNWDQTTPDPDDVASRFSLAKDNAGTAGFNLPANTSILRFKLKSPELNDLEQVLDGSGQKTDEMLPLHVDFDFYPDLDNMCVLHALDSLFGSFEIEYAKLRIDSIVPNIGPTTGGTYTGNSTLGNPYGIDLDGRVMVYGFGFAGRQSDLKLLLGGVACKDLQIIDNNTLSCVPDKSYPGSYDAGILADTRYREGVVNVKLVLDNGQLNSSDSLVNAYTYRYPLTIEKVTPDNGATRGGQQVEIVGHNFLPPPQFNIPLPVPGFQVLFAAVNDNTPALANIVKVTNDTVYVTTQYHLANHVNVTVDNTKEKQVTGNLPFTYYPTVFTENGLWSEFQKWEDHSSENIVPSDRANKHNQVGTIHIKANVVQNIPVDLDSITVYPGKTYTVDFGKEVKANVFTIKDNASFLNNGVDAIAEARAQHTLPKGRNWYVSSPTQGDVSRFPAVVPALSKDTLGNNLTQEWRVEWYDETAHAWQSTADNYELVTGKGYTAYSEKADIAANFSGRFTDGDRSIPLTRQTDAHPKRGFNLVGNPFPSYWRWTDVAAQAADTYSSIWYRTNPSGTYEGYAFWTYNASGNVAAAPGWENEDRSESYSLAYIPPMQAFWVRLKDGKTNGALTFTNNLRSHTNHSTNILKSAAKTGDIRPLLRLSVSNGNQIDETVIYADPAAQNNFDRYDSDKLFTDRGVELFTIPGTEYRQLAINGLQQISAGMEIPLGFQANESGIFSFSAKEIQNLDTLDVILRDKWRRVEFDLRRDGEYSFTSNSTSGSERFSIAFRRSGLLGIDSEWGNNLLAYSNSAGQIVVELHDRSLPNGSVEVSVFDITGRKLTTQSVTVNERTVLEGRFTKGIYVLRAGKKAAIKVVVQ